MNTSQRKPMLSRRVEMSIDVEELQMFDGIAQCANHTLEFKISKFNIVTQLIKNRAMPHCNTNYFDLTIKRLQATSTFN